MEKFLQKIEGKFDTQMKKFEDSPIRTGLKFIIIIYVLKMMWGWVKDEENEVKENS